MQKQTLAIPLTPSAIIVRAAAGLGITVSEYINKTLGSVLPPVPTGDRQKNCKDTPAAGKGEA